MGILCKTPREAERLFETIRAGGENARLRSADSTAFVQVVSDESLYAVG